MRPLTPSARWDTRRLYQWEAQQYRGRPTVAMSRLHALLRRVWRDLCPQTPCPVLRAGRGTRYHGRWYSYYDGTEIVLARNERTVPILLHELTHALGHDVHDAAFRDQYAHLLQRYGGRTGRQDATALRRTFS